MLFTTPLFTPLLLLLSTLLPQISTSPTPTLKRPNLVKRYDLEDATDVAKIKDWMGENIDNENFVFYSGNSVGAPMAKAFCDENTEEGYKYFYYIFDDAFSQAFAGADPSSQTDIAKACSSAMAQYATGETRVFNDAGAASDSFWKTIELPGLRDNSDVTKIWSMDDNTLDPDAHKAGDIKTPPAPASPPPPAPSCKSGGMYSDESSCEKDCVGGGHCESGSAGFPVPQLYYTCECPVSV